VQVRLHNYSNVPMRFDRVDLQVRIDGHPAGTLELAPAISIAANSVEVLSATLQPSAAARQTVESALSIGVGIAYQLTGNVVTSDPRGNWKQDFSSRLDRVPGLEGVLR
jgi:hypothetical protein